MLFVTILFLLASAGTTPADVAVIKTAGVTAFDEARNGFSSTCFENKQEFSLLEDQSNQTQIVDQIKAGGFKLVLAIGPQAAIFAKNNFSELPVVFCLVVNPERFGLKADNVTGVSLGVPIKEQFAILRSINKKAKRIGVIYTQPANDWLITSARNEASNQDMTIIAASISSSQDIQKAVNEVIGNADALWIPPDPSLNSDEVIRYISTTSLTKKIPCVGPNERYVRSGAIFTLAADAVESGKAAGDIANRILQGAPVNSIPVQELQKPKIIINVKAAGLLGLNIPKNVQDAASKIYQ